MMLPELIPDDAPIVLPRRLIRFPVEINLPVGFRPGEPNTWPQAEGRLEYVDGRLLFMPPCGEAQGSVVANIAGLLWSWARSHPGFSVETNEAGMYLEGDVRGADVAIWPRQPGVPRQGGFHRSAPILAVEVAGLDEEEARLQTKARWYLERGVKCVWLALHDSREIVVIDANGQTRYGFDTSFEAGSLLPGLSLSVADVFGD